MKVAHIAPPSMLWTLRNRSYHLVVAQRLLEPKYLWHWKAARKRGDFIIVDNGAVEVAYSKELEPISFEKVLELASAIKADEVVMPDVFRDMDKTLSHTQAALPHVPIRHRMFVPQGDSIDGWKNCMSTMYQWGARSIGIPKHMERFNGGRYYLCKWIEQMSYHNVMDFHLLGVWDSPEAEVKPIAKDFPWVRGIDTGVAYAYAQHNRALTNYAGEHIGLDWNAQVNDRHAEYNMETLERWAHAGP
jgi:hypothetical protein